MLAKDTDIEIVVKPQHYTVIGNYMAVSHHYS